MKEVHREALKHTNILYLDPELMLQKFWNFLGRIRIRILESLDPDPEILYSLDPDPNRGLLSLGRIRIRPTRPGSATLVKSKHIFC